MRSMKKFYSIILLLLALADVHALAQGTAFTYQGRLNDGANPANGFYDFRFRLASDPLANNYIGSNVFSNDVQVTAGLFTVTLDFGPNIFMGSNIWLEVDVRTNGGSSYTILNPLQPLTPSPYAIFAGIAGTVTNGAITSTQLASGSVGTTQIQSSAINASQIASGQVVKSLNGLEDDVTLTPGTNVSINAFGNSLQISETNPGWSLTGNSGTTPGANFVGTTDNQPLQLHVNGGRALRIEPNTNGAPNIIAGSQINSVANGLVGATIAGGGATNWSGIAYSNTVLGNFGTIGGGYGNILDSYAGVIAGGYQNANHGFAGFLGAGDGNVIVGAGGGDGAVLVGGYGNTNGGEAAVIGGGQNNFIGGSADHAFIGAGADNSIIGAAGPSFGAIAGGLSNNIGINVSYGTIGGGLSNAVTGSFGLVPGGTLNVASNYSFAAGYRAKATNSSSFVWSDTSGLDFGSTANNQFNVRATGGARFITGGAGLTVDGAPVFATSSGITIQQNTNGAPNVIEGSPANSVSNTVVGATISGGGALNYQGGYSPNIVNGNFGTVGGGLYNVASGPGSTIGGGGTDGSAIFGNTASGTLATISGGMDNSAGGYYSFIGGGFGNSAGYYGVTGGGDANNTSGDYSFIGGGDHNTASGQFSVVCGGQYNSAVGDDSFAGGQEAHANHRGSFVWADSQIGSFSSSANDQFAVRAFGGANFQTASGFTANCTSGSINLSSSAGVSMSASSGAITATPSGGMTVTVSGSHGLSPAAFYINSTSGNGVAFYATETSSDAAVVCNNAGTGSLIKAFNGGGNPAFEVVHDGTVYSKGVALTSDRNAKENFSPINTSAVLEKVAAMPITSWRYKNDEATHIGPVAQDFHAAFNLNGNDDKRISVVDEGGVALAAIQGLNQKLKEKDAQIQDLQKSIAELKAMVAQLAARNR